MILLRSLDSLRNGNTLFCSLTVSFLVVSFSKYVWPFQRTDLVEAKTFLLLAFTVCFLKCYFSVYL